jgi:hypothetical protein
MSRHILILGQASGRIDFFREVEQMKIRAVCLFIILITGFAAVYVWAADQEKVIVMNPRGIQPEIRKIPMAKRPSTLNGKTVYI